MKTAPAYLIDFDGTLADTKHANYTSYAKALAEQGIDIDFDTFMQLSDGKHWSIFLPVIFKALNTQPSATAESIALRKTEIYKTQAALISFNEPLIALLKNVANHSKVALVTTASKANVTSALTHRTDLLNLFDLIITGEDVTQHKPHPEAYFKAAQLLNVTPQECIIFEDSHAGIAAGVSFGGQVIKTYI